MKNKVLTFLGLLIFITSCQNAEKTPVTLDGKKKLLGEYKQQATDLTDKIATLEKEIAKMDTTAAKSFKMRQITIDTVKTSDFKHYIEISGSVKADQEVLATPQAGGTIVGIYVKVGDRVTAGQIIAQIDDAVLKQGLALAEQQYDFATTTFNKQKSLWDQKIGSEIQFLNAKNAMDAAAKQVKQAKDQISMYRVKSPITGVVDDLPIKIGGAVAPGSPCARIVNLSKLKVSAEAPEAYANMVKAGDKVKLVFPDLNKEVESNVRYVSKVISTSSRTFNIEATLKPNEAGVMPNMVSRVLIADYASKNTIVIPVNYVQKDATTNFVYVASKEGEHMVARKKQVQAGVIYGSNIEIKSGLKSGDLVVTRGYVDLNEGDYLQVNN